MVYLNCENGLTQFAGKYVRTRLKSIEKRPLLDMLDANLLCKFVLQIVEKHLRWTMAV